MYILKRSNLLAKIVENAFKHQNRPSGAEDGERLTGEQAVNDAAQEPRAQRLHGAETVFSGVAQQPAERNERRQTSEIQERERRQTLNGQGVGKVRSVPELKN